MKFYDIDNALREAIEAADKPVRLKIEIECAVYFESVFEQDIIDARFYGLKEAAGGISARGEVLLDNSYGIYAYTGAGAGPGTEVRVSFSIGEGLPYFRRFVLYIDDKGIEDIRGPGRKRYARIGLRDFSARLRKTDDTRDWTNRAVYAYSVVCDKTKPDSSLVHRIAKRVGLEADDIDCSTIPITIPYVSLDRDSWAELSDLATACRCHVECAPEKPLVFAHSPYQTEPMEDDDYSYTFRGDRVFYVRKTMLPDFYRNTVRLRFNLPVVLEKQELWRYNDAPLLYDDNVQPYYPFKDPLVREIEEGVYEAPYTILTKRGKERPVVFADALDTKEEADGRLVYDGGPFLYSHYDTSSSHDRAFLTLRKEADGVLYKARIYGEPIVLDMNTSCYMRDTEEIAAYGTVALNVTGSYFSGYSVNGRPHYEDWVARELAERKKRKREYTVKTHTALFNARVGAKVTLEMRNEEVMGIITSFTLKYGKDTAFIASFTIAEQ